MTASTSEVMAGLVKALRKAKEDLGPLYTAFGYSMAGSMIGRVRLDIDEALAAYESHERIQLASHYLDARGRSFPAQVEDDPPGVRHGRAM